MNHMRGTYRVILLSLMLVLVVVSIPTIFTNYIVNATSANLDAESIAVALMKPRTRTIA
jgi:hypothetical protein